jgi:hypothetical protein
MTGRRPYCAVCPFPRDRLLVHRATVWSREENALFHLEALSLVPQMNCHLDRSVAKWRDLRFTPQQQI